MLAWEIVWETKDKGESGERMAIKCHLNVPFLSEQILGYYKWIIDLILMYFTQECVCTFKWIKYHKAPEDLYHELL